MLLKSLLLSLVPLAIFTACTTDNTISEKSEDTKRETSKKVIRQKPLAVSAKQVRKVENIIDGLTNSKNTGGGISSPEELFKVINGEYQTTVRELPTQSTVTKAVSQGLLITCYQEGNKTIVASTDPTMIGQPISSFTTSDGEPVYSLAIEEIRKNNKSGAARATFTYTPSDKSPVVNGNPVKQGRVVAAAGRKAFKGFNSEKKFLCTVAADIAHP